MKQTLLLQEPPRSLIYRVTVFAYGVAAYAIGVASLLALILTMLGLLAFNGGPWSSVSLGAALAIDLGLLVAFALQTA